ncbi:hypothetical protein VPH35_049760 [Triticum aestivum]
MWLTMYLAHALQEQDVLSLKELVDTKTLEESPITATSLPSPQDTIEISPSSWCCLSSNPSMAREGRVHRAASGFLGDEEAAEACAPFCEILKVAMGCPSTTANLFKMITIDPYC